MKRDLVLKDCGKKGIYFLVREDSGLFFKDLDVDLSKLEGTALLLANLIYTTEHRDDLSRIYIESTKTHRELYKLEGKSDAYIEKIETVWGINFLNKRPIMTWSWDCLKSYETPEEFFIRHADKISKVDGKIIGSFLYQLS